MLFVSFASPQRAEAYRREFELDAPMLIDRERSVYRAYGMRESLLGAGLSPRVWISYARLIIKVRRLPRARENPLQLGGNFVVGPDGRLVLARPTARSTDRPDAETLMEAVREVQKIAS